MDQYHTTFEQVQRGRAVVIGDISLERERYQYHQEDKNGETTYQRQVLHHYHDENPILDTLLSKANLDAMQIQIRKGVYDQIGKLISNQDTTELVLVLRSVYLSHSKNIQGNRDVIIQQVKELNRVALNDIVPKICSEIQQYLSYLRDASTLYNERPIERPILTSSKGTKTYSFTNHF